MPVRNYLQHGRRHALTGSDPVTVNEWCLAFAGGSVPGTDATTQFDLELAFGSGIDTGLFTQDTASTFDTVQINEPGTFRVQWTANWAGTIASPSEGQQLLAKADTGTGLQTSRFGFGGVGVAGSEYLRATGGDYSGTSTAHGSNGGFLHWPTNEDSPPTFATSLIGMSSKQDTGSSLTLALWVFIQRIDLYMLDNGVFISWDP